MSNKKTIRSLVQFYIMIFQIKGLLGHTVCLYELQGIKVEISSSYILGHPVNSTKHKYNVYITYIYIFMGISLTNTGYKCF